MNIPVTGGLFGWCGCSKSKCGESCINVPEFSCSAKQCGTTSLPCSGCSEKHCGRISTSIPDTLKIEYTDMTYCELAGSAGLPINAIKSVTEYCPCMEKALEYSSKNLSEGDVSGVFLEGAASLIECFAESSSSYSTEKYEVMENEKQKGGVLIEGKEIGLKFYSQLIGAVALCFASGKCDDILNTMASLFDDTVDSVGDDLVASLRAYISSLIEPVEVNLTTFSSIKDEFDTALSVCVKEVESQADEIAEAFMEAANGMAMFVDKTLDLIGTIEETAQATGPAIDSISAAFDAMTGSFTERIVESIEEGSLDAFNSLIKVVEVIRDNEEVNSVIESGNSVVSLLDELDDDISKIKEDADTLLDLVDGLNADECKSKVPSVMKFIETAAEKFMSELKFGKVNLYLRKSMSDNHFSCLFLHLHSLMAGQLDIQAGIASYSSSMSVRIDNLPCSKLVTKKFGDASLCPNCVVKLDVPEFYACSAEFDIYLPKEHMPYLRVITSDGRRRRTLVSSKTSSNPRLRGA